QRAGAPVSAAHELAAQPQPAPAAPVPAAAPDPAPNAAAAPPRAVIADPLPASASARAAQRRVGARSERTARPTPEPGDTAAPAPKAPRPTHAQHPALLGIDAFERNVPKSTSERVGWDGRL